MNPFSSFCDDFYTDMYVNTELQIPYQRDTAMAFFERVQKHYPQMTNFVRRGNNEYCLEEDKKAEQYRWVCLEDDRVGSGIFNPYSLSETYEQDALILDLIPYMLGINHLDINCVDLTFAMDFDCEQNHDEVIAEAFFSSTVFGNLLEMPNARPICLSPTVLVSLNEDNSLQARLSIESKTSIFESNKNKPVDDSTITLFFSVRRYPSGAKFNSIEAFKEQTRIIEEIMSDKIIPFFIKPLTNVIAQKRIN